jgi:hypothetical protein
MGVVKAFPVCMQRVPGATSQLKYDTGAMPQATDSCTVSGNALALLSRTSHVIRRLGACQTCAPVDPWLRLSKMLCGSEFWPAIAGPRRKRNHGFVAPLSDRAAGL